MNKEIKHHKEFDQENNLLYEFWYIEDETSSFNIPYFEIIECKDKVPELNINKKVFKGKLHREDGFAVISYYPNTNFKTDCEPFYVKYALNNKYFSKDKKEYWIKELNIINNLKLLNKE